MNDQQSDRPDDHRGSTPEWYLQPGLGDPATGADAQDAAAPRYGGQPGPGYPPSPERPDYQQGYPHPGPPGPWGAGYPPAYPPAYPTGGPLPGLPDPQQAAADRAARNAMVLGILGIVFGSLGIIFGPIALSKAAKAERLGGRAPVGKVLGWVALAVGVFWILGLGLR
ncbi:DUF4190 domain-containing protein [Citricoccus sp. SGAir0253]|uniref:DUF4190 domain-containing protein n=1 Tax=Citricoccus sp. SGAir0253 TaxID=2567881 RepID=UPI0010CD04D1|nr:DUF4190 domain-containing protein [Citricoccus sp. SGAir0253]QCU77517.1 DUF4190 domain-containing protein [Citricoccus sp. SGAir0253]